MFYALYTHLCAGSYHKRSADVIADSVDTNTPNGPGMVKISMYNYVYCYSVHNAGCPCGETLYYTRYNKRICIWRARDEWYCGSYNVGVFTLGLLHAISDIG